MWSLKDKVIDLAKGVKRASLQNIDNAFPDMVQFFQYLENGYGAYEIYKAISSAVWGDNIRTHRVTGKPVQIVDMSQLFILFFSEMVPIEQIIEELQWLDIVEYAHGPIRATDTCRP